jgi:hypothetical protein
MLSEEERKQRRRESSARYRLKNPEKVRAQFARWYAVNSGRNRAYQKRYKADHAERYRSKSRVKMRLGWAPGEAERAESMLPLVEACAICLSPEPRTKTVWHADHDHETGMFRSFLCSPCNVRLGLAERHGIQMSDSERRYVESHRRPV